MKWYPWLTAHYKELVSNYSSGRAHHALLLHFPEQFGESLLVNALGRWLMCTERRGEKICGHCRACQLMYAGNHPDWHALTPENNRSSIGVEQIRQLTETLYEHAQQGGIKVVWLADAELLTEAAANALLKTLEEPPVKTFFILGCVEPNKLLATVRSRCLYWPLANPNEAYSCQWLVKNYPSLSSKHILTAIRLSGGSPLKAFNLLVNERWLQRLALCQVLNNAIDQQDLLSIMPTLNQENVIERLDWMLSLWMDGLKQQQNAQDYLVNLDQLTLISQISTRFDSQSLQRICQRWVLCRHRLLNVSGINSELLLTNLLLQTETGDFSLIERPSL